MAITSAASAERCIGGIWRGIGDGPNLAEAESEANPQDAAAPAPAASNNNQHQGAPAPRRRHGRHYEMELPVVAMDVITKCIIVF